MDYPTGMNLVYAIRGSFHGAHAIYDYLDEKLGKEDGQADVRSNSQSALDIIDTDSPLGGGGTPWFIAKEYFEGAVDRVGRTDSRANHALELLDAWDGKFVSGGEAAWISGTARERRDGFLSTNWISEALKNGFL